MGDPIGENDATGAADASVRACLNCRYSFPVDGDTCPECGLSQSDQGRAAARRRQRRRVVTISLLIAAAATGPITFSHLFGVADYGMPGSVFAIVQVVLLPVIALLWGHLFDVIDPRGHVVGKLLLGVVLAAASVVLGVLTVDLLVLVIWGPR